MNLDEQFRDRPLFPRRTLIVSFPVSPRQYSETETVFGERVRHVLTMGPAKGGIRYHEDVNPGQVIALAMRFNTQQSMTATREKLDEVPVAPEYHRNLKDILHQCKLWL